MVWEEKEIAEEPIAPECGHHWVIEPADGLFREGACQKCGEVKTFTDYVERHDWNQGKAAPGISQAPGVEGSALESETGDGTGGV